MGEKVDILAEAMKKVFTETVEGKAEIPDKAKGVEKNSDTYMVDGKNEPDKKG